MTVKQFNEIDAEEMITIIYEDYKISFFMSDLMAITDLLRLEISTIDELYKEDRYNYLSLYYYFSNIIAGQYDSLIKICFVYNMFDEDSFDNSFFPVFEDKIKVLFNVEKINNKLTK